MVDAGVGVVDGNLRWVVEVMDGGVGVNGGGGGG